MAQSQAKSKRAPSGKKLKPKGKKQYMLGRKPLLPKIEKLKMKKVRTMGGNFKSKLLNSDVINAIDPKTKKAVKVVLKTVADNTANKNFIRRNILTKGAIIETDKGKVKITNRPGQEGTINGVFV